MQLRDQLTSLQGEAFGINARLIQILREFDLAESPKGQPRMAKFNQHVTNFCKEMGRSKARAVRVVRGVFSIQINYRGGPGEEEVLRMARDMIPEKYTFTVIREED